MLSVRGLRVEYGHVQALRGVDLEAREGEITAIIGSNGAGKTSTLMAISGLAPMTGGEILFRGRSIARAPAHTITALGITQILEGRQLFADQTVEDNLLLGAYSRPRGARHRTAELMVREIARTIQTLKDAGATIVLVEQMASVALQLADRAYVLENGRVTLAGTGRELADNPDVKRAYLGG